MNKVALVPIVLLLAACAGPQTYYGPAPEPYRANPPRTTPRSSPPALRQSEQPALRRVPGNVPSAGPLRTAMVGSYMDDQERDFRAHLRGPGVSVVRPGDELVLRLPDAMLFEGRSDRLSVAGRNALATIAIIARHYYHTAIGVTAYTDGSDREARLVASVLAADGVSARRLASRSGTLVNGGAKTRRIEIRISPQATG